MTICSKCLLTDKYPNISFDSSGVCSFCNPPKQYKPQGIYALY